MNTANPTGMHNGQWNNKQMAEYYESLLEPTSPTPPWSSNMTGEYKNHGVVRINFPFGQVEMDVRNEAELDRMVDMAKHMLKVHEENEATAAIRSDLDAKKSNPQVESTSANSTTSALAFGQGSSSITGS